MSRIAIFCLCLVALTAGCGRLGSLGSIGSGGGGSLGSAGSLGLGSSAGADQQTPRRPLVPEGAVRRVVDQRARAPRIVDTRFERTPDGGILLAQAMMTTQGYYNAELVFAGVKNGTRNYVFRVQPPGRVEPAGARGARLITAATAISNGDLAGIAQLSVRGAGNALSVRP